MLEQVRKYLTFYIASLGVPDDLVKQLKQGGILFSPVQDPFGEEFINIIRKEKDGTINITKTLPVVNFLINLALCSSY
jgi:protein-L-isoaspartate O-methyltransferase